MWGQPPPAVQPGKARQHFVFHSTEQICPTSTRPWPRFSPRLRRQHRPHPRTGGPAQQRTVLAKALSLRKQLRPSCLASHRQSELLHRRADREHRLRPRSPARISTTRIRHQKMRLSNDWTMQLRWCSKPSLPNHSRIGQQNIRARARMPRTASTWSHSVSHTCSTTSAR